MFLPGYLYTMDVWSLLHIHIDFESGNYNIM